MQKTGFTRDAGKAAARPRSYCMAREKFPDRGRQIALRGDFEHVAAPDPDPGKGGVAQPRCPISDQVENRREVPGGAVDGLQNFRRRGLLNAAADRGTSEGIPIEAELNPMRPCPLCGLSFAKGSHRPYNLPNFRHHYFICSRVSAVPVSPIPVSSRSAWRSAAMHPASSVFHGRPSTGQAGSASGAATGSIIGTLKTSYPTGMGQSFSFQFQPLCPTAQR